MYLPIPHRLNWVFHCFWLLESVSEEAMSPVYSRGLKQIRASKVLPDFFQCLGGVLTKSGDLGLETSPELRGNGDGYLIPSLDSSVFLAPCQVVTVFHD